MATLDQLARQAKLGNSSALNDLLRQAESGNSGALGQLRQMSGALSPQRQGELAAAEKVLAKQAKEQQRALAAAEREQRAANREAERAYKGDAIAFFFDPSIGKVRPITAPSGSPMKKWGKSGTMFDPVTGKAYVRDDNGKLIEVDPEKDGETVKKDGHVYKVVPGMKWKWAGYDGDSKIKPDKEVSRDLAERTRAVKEQAQLANGELAIINKDLASDRSRLRDIDRQLNSIDITPEQRANLQAEKTSVQGLISAKVERQAKAELDAYKAQADLRSWTAERNDILQSHLKDKAGLIYRDNTLPNTDRRGESVNGLQSYISDLSNMALEGSGLDMSRDIQPAGATMMSDLWDGLNRRTAAMADASERNFQAFGDNISSPSFTNQWTQAAMKPRLQEATRQLSAQAPIALPADVAKATGYKYAQPEWFTEEAMWRQDSARLAGQDVIKAPTGYKLENGTLYATKETSSTFWGIPLPWSKKTVDEPIGKFKFDQYGVGYVELDPLAKQSPSFASGNHYRGMPEYSAMPTWFKESLMPKMGSQVVAEVRAEVAKQDWNKLAQDAWDGQRWGSERLRDVLDQWQGANDAERANMIAKLDPSQASLAPQDRRLDTRKLYESGQLSAQDARLFENTAYGTNPGFAGLPQAFDNWAANSQSAAAKAYRDAQAKQPKLSFWQNALATVTSAIPGVGLQAMLAKAEPQRIAAANDYAARTAFMSEYFKETSRKVDFNDAAFTAARDKMLGDESWVGWAGNALNSSLQNALGSSAGIMLVQAPKLILDGITGGRMLSDEERTLIGAQTEAAWKNMQRALTDRVPSSLGEALLMATPASYLYNLGGVRDRVWAGEKGGALNKEINDFIQSIDYGRLDEAKMQDHARRIERAASAFHAGYDQNRMSYENNILDKRSGMAQALAGYMQTRDPAYAAGIRGAALNSQYEQEIQRQASAYASANGQISESSFFGPLQMAFRGAQVAPLTETGIELASNLIGFGAAKALSLGKWMSTAEKAGLTLNRVGRAVGKLENIEQKFFELGKVQRPIGGTLTAGQQLRNTAVDLAKQGWASGGGEMFEEVVAAFGEAGMTLGGAAAQGLQGLIGGVGLSAIHAPIGAAVGSMQAASMERARTAALNQFVADYNTRYAETPITLEQAKQSQGYQSRPLVQTLNSQLQDLLGRDLVLSKELKTLAPVVLQPSPAGAVSAANPRITQIAEERGQIRAQTAATMLDIVGVSENAIRAVQEINALEAETAAVVDAAVRSVSQTTLTPRQEQDLMGAGAYVRGDRIIVPDTLRAQIEQAAPITAAAYLRKTEAEQLAEVEIAVPQQAAPQQRQQPAKPVVRQPAVAQQAPVTPAPTVVSQQTTTPTTPTPQQPAAGGAGSYTFTATYTPRGSQRPVTVTQTVQAATPEEAQTKQQTWAAAIERRMADGPVQVSPVQAVGGQAAAQPGLTSPAAVDPAIFTAKPTAKSVTAMVEAAAPTLFNNPALPQVVVTPRLYVTRRFTSPITQEQYRALPAAKKKDYVAMPNGGMAAYGGSSTKAPAIYIDQSQMAKALAAVAPEQREAKVRAMVREEILHVATTRVRGPEELEGDWARLPDVVKRQVIEAYYPVQVMAAENQDWRNVNADPQMAALEFWRMYLSAKLDGVTTEQVAFAREVDAMAELDPSFAASIQQLLEGIANWLRENLMGTLDEQTRAEFEDVAAKIEAELANIEARGSPVAQQTQQEQAAAEEQAPLPENQAFVPAPDTGSWKPEAVRAAVQSAAAAFGYKIVDTGLDVGAVDRYGNVVNLGTQMYDKFVPGSEVGQWIDKVGNSEFAAEIAEKMATPGLHRVWFGHDFLTNLDNVVGQFGWSAVPDYILQLLKDSLTKSGIPFPGVELLVRDGTVSDRVATDWLSTNIGEVFGGGVALFGTYRLMRATQKGTLTRPQAVFATVGVGIKLVAGVATAQPFLIISGLADAAILVTNLKAVKEAFKKAAEVAQERPARPVVRPPQMQVAPPMNPVAQAPPVSPAEVVAEAPAVVAPEQVVEAPAEAAEAPQPAVAERIDAADDIVADPEAIQQGMRELDNGLLPKIDAARTAKEVDAAVREYKANFKAGNPPKSIVSNLISVLEDKAAAKKAQLRAEKQQEASIPQTELEQALEEFRRFLPEQRGPDGLTDTERANLEAELRADQEAEAAEAAGAGGIDILDAVREAGGLPAKTSRKVNQYAGELQRIRDAQKGGRAIGVKGAFNLFRNDAPDLDGLIKDLQTMGFRDIATPSDVFDLLERRLTTGRPIYGYEGMVLAAAAPSISAQMDAEYMGAVERGDMETAQRMVDQAAGEAGFNIGPVYHGTRRKFGQFSKRMSLPNYKNAQTKLGFFFSPDKEYAEMYGTEVLSVYLRGNLKQEPVELIDEIEGEWTNQQAGRYVAQAKREGYDGVVFRGYFYNQPIDREIAVFSANQIKSADPVTYDSRGKVIPLSLRFDTTTAKIAFAAAPSGAEFIAAATRLMDAAWNDGITTPEGLAAYLVEKLGAAATPKLLSQVWANGSQTDPDVQVSWTDIRQKAVDENVSPGNNNVGERIDRQAGEEAGGDPAAVQVSPAEAGRSSGGLYGRAGGGRLEDGRGAAGSARNNERVLNRLPLDGRGREARIAEAFGDDWPDGYSPLGMPNLPRGLTDPNDPRLQETADKETATIVAGSLANRVLGIPAGEVSRRVLRETIIEYFMRGGNDRKALTEVQEPQSQENPLVIFMGGGGAAGKTSLLNREVAKGNIPDEGRVLSNADEIREFLPEYDLLNELNDARSSVVTHEEASMIADEIKRRARQNSFPMAIDGTMKNPAKALAELEMLRNEGYRAKMIAVTIDPYEALVRSFLRGKGSKRYVPPRVLLGAHKGFNAALPAYIEAFGDDLVIYDNSPQNPILLAADDILSGRFAEVAGRAGMNENAATPEELLGSYGEGDRIERSAAPVVETNDNPQRRAAEAILGLLQENRKLDFIRDIQPLTDAAYGGTLASGTYEIKDAYDAMELAVNLFLAQGGVFDADQGWKSFGPVGAIRALEDLQQRLPTQTKRSGRTDRYQQFSTPPVFSFVAHWASGATAADVVLEPSAGIGGLAVYPKLDGATIIANELEPNRIAFLREMGFDHLTTENAEQIDAILEPRFASGSLPRPTVVNMNPPFSNAAKSGKTGQTMVGAKHVESALRTLQPGGRLVAIVGEGMGLDAPTFRQWWQNMAKQYHVRANIWVDGRNYTKYGTSFSNRLLVIDKVAPPAGSTAANIIQGQIDDLADLITLLQGVRNDRPTIQPSAEQAGAGDAQSLEQPANAGLDASARTGVGGRAGRDGGRTGRAGVRQSQTQRPGDGAVSVERSVPTGGLAGREERAGSRADDPQRTDGERGTDGQPTLPGSVPSVEQTGITVEGAQGSARTITNEDDVFALYTPAKVRIPGAQTHPAPLVESAAMASVVPPDPTYTPNLPKEVITEGRISQTSLENIVYAGQAHAQTLPNGERRGYFIGDGTGVGKGRQIAGIIMDNMRQGRTKAVWISKSTGLIEDAKRDAADIGIDPKKVVSLSSVKKGKKIEAKDGILFATYDTLKGGHETIVEGADTWWDRLKEHNSRMQQIAEWLGRDFDGVIALDEAHKAGNAIAVRGKRGIKKPSQAGVAVVDLQKLLPNARVVYVSATGATEVENLSYADRLGIWGEGTPFANKGEFFTKIRAGGVSAMEVVARDLKAQGLYLARSISYKGVEFARLTHPLTPEQEAIYNTISNAWQKVLANMDQIMDVTGASESPKARMAASSAFWGAQQRFFNQLLTGLQLPSLLSDMDRQLEAGNSLVLQLVNTGEAVEKRALAKARTEAEGDEVPLEDLDLSPRQILLDFLDKSFPTDLYEEVQDPGNPERTIWQPVRDSEGKSVKSPQAEAQKQRLMDEVALIDMPESPLNQIINKFGPDNVAEITGRKQRVVEVRKGTKTQTILEKRGKSQARSEAQEFQDGNRRILIFSDAGGTGYSFHASNRAKNQQRRIHYLVQAGWRADSALQGFGRTHRTDQASAPVYRLLETNIKGHKRFIASIARRLAQLGALTTGERRTAGQGMFNDSDNLESPYAADALFRLWSDLYNEKVEGMSFDELSESLGYVQTRGEERVNTLMSQQQGGLNIEKLPPITQFLNRILALPLDRQNMVFDLFMDRLERRIEMAKADGSFDPGTQTLRATRVEVLSDDVIYTQPETGAATRLVEVQAFEDQVFTTFEEAERGGAMQWVKNRKSGNIYALREGPPKTLDTGAVVQTWRRVGTTGNDLVQRAKVSTAPGRMEGEKLVDAGNYIELTRDEAATAWDSEIANAPTETSRKENFLVGVMLPVWDRIGLERTRIFRFTPTTGEPMLGVQVPAKEVPGLRQRMGARNTMTADQAFDMVLQDGARLELANGWMIFRRRVSGEQRVEVDGLTMAQGNNFAREFGGVMERIEYRPRFFITDSEVMESVMDRSPVVRINGEPVNTEEGAEPTVAGVRRLVTAEDMDADMDEQARWLFDQAQLRGYENTDELVTADYETFQGLTAVWRETHPRAVGGVEEGAGDRGGTETDERIEALVNDNLGLATALAQRFNIAKTDMEDKVQEARIGLLTAAQSFDESRGVPFGAYATRVIRNRLNNLYRNQRRIAGAEVRELDAPVGEMDGETGQSMLADQFEDAPNTDDLAIIREIMDDLPARPRRIWQGVMAGKTYDAIGEEEGISKQAVQQTMVATQNTLRRQLARRGINNVDDVFAQRNRFDTGRVEGTRAELDDEESAVAATQPSFAAELASIAEERQRAQDYRKAAEKGQSSGSILDGAKESYAKWLRGRLDKVEFYAPGAKAAILDNRRNEALVAATINSMMQQMRDDITRAFGYPKFWSKNKTRLQNFLDELLPVAARLEVDRLDDEGNFVFKPFLMRTGTIAAAKVRARGLKVGDMVATDRGNFEVGPEIEGGKHLLLKSMPAAVQQQIYEDFHARYPESAHYLDRWIMPGMQEARYMGPQGTMTAEFNRYALRDLFNEWPQELQDLFGGLPLPEMPYVEGYTPDVAEAKTLTAMIGSMLRSFRSGARKIKAGEARESGNIKNMFEGFSVRAMEAHREKIRVLTRQRLIEAAAVPTNRIPKDQLANYVELDQTYRKLLEAVKIARRLNPSAFPALTGALSPQDQKAMSRILGDAVRLRGRGLMIHEQVERELMLGVARQVGNNALTKLLSGLLERYNAGLLATPFTTITNWASNELIKVVRTSNRFLYAVLSALSGDMKAAKLGGYEAMYLFRGFLTDRFPQWQKDRIGKVVPRELFDDQTGLEAMDIDPNISVKQQLGRLNLGGAFMQAIGYGEIDIRQKQQMAYAGYRAHAQIAWNEAKARGEVSNDTNRREWQQNWIANAPAEIHRDVYTTTVMYLMDYQNVPAWIDPQQSMTATGQIIKRATLPFVKWPYNMARQFKRLTFDAALNTVMAGRTKQQRIEGMANLMTMAGLAALGAAISMGDDDEDDPLLGSNIDDEGQLLDAAFRTANRINLSRLARIIFAHGLMSDVEFTLDDGSGEAKDLWWRYRNYPYLKEGIAMGLLMTGKTDEAMQQLSDISGEYVSLGMLAKVVGMSSFDKDKPVGFRLGEVVYDVGTAGVLPPPWRQFATRMADPVFRRSTPMEAIGYSAGPLDAIKANTPFLSRTVPSAGISMRNRVAFAPFSAESWFRKESQTVMRSDLPAEQKQATVDALRQQAAKMNMSPQQQADFMRLAGLPVDRFNMQTTSSVPIISNLERLRSMGIGPESLSVIETKDKNNRTSTMLVGPKASMVGYQPRGLQALRFFGGVNLMAVPRGKPELAK